ncbi:hypothetical protein Hanom_Chr04g00337091 [Helianthus anomalus]
MVHQQAYLCIHRIHPDYLVARTKIHTRIHNQDTLDASGNIVHQQVELELVQSGNWASFKSGNCIF